MELLAQLIATIRAETREECALMAKAFARETRRFCRRGWEYEVTAALAIADRIRAGGEK